MTQEDKELLLKDLCARLPYRVKCERYGKAYELDEIDINRGLVYIFRDDWCTPTSLPYRIGCDDIRLYLRPMSSMTDEEYNYVYNGHINFWSRCDYCNSHHLDYRGLIEKGLALEAPKDMYKDLNNK